MQRIDHRLLLSIALLGSVLTGPGHADTRQVATDVCIYGATPSGILAAIAVRRRGRLAVIVEPGRWVGGILGAGLKPSQDCPNIEATGGMTRDLLATLGQPMVEEDGRQVRASLGIRQLNPEDIRRDFLDLVRQHGIEVVYDHRVAACEKDGSAIRSVSFDRAPFDELGCPVTLPAETVSLRVTARIFIDASYEGDLMARAGVSFRVGRESAQEFGEELAGVRPPMEEAPIDPFVERGNPGSGLLRWVEDDHGKPIGAADGYTQAYNYRYYLTADPEHRVALTPPAGYDPADFELVGRYVEHLAGTLGDEAELEVRLGHVFPGWANSGDWNYYRESLFSMAPVGISQLYADGDYAAKARIWKEHQDYVRGLHHFMSTDRRVPEAFRRKTAALGLDRRRHPETGGWPHQLYIRVARRLAGRYTLTADDVYNRTTVDDPIGLAQYGIDTYPSRRIWFQRQGQTYVALEGKMFVGGARGPTNVPYPVPYRAVTPEVGQCSNLLVPVCFSATHLGYASARMEPVFMICGESAGIAACHALAENAAVQEIDMPGYRRALEEAGQVLGWTEELAARAGSGGSGHSYSFESLREICDRDGDQRVSQAEWNAGKPGWQWLFPIIDKSGEGQIDEAEYAAFQEYKRTHPEWSSARPASPAGQDE
ncbi:MAG: FAD-dependent oxidoreductase [Thermoguttaceae bacterium]